MAYGWSPAVADTSSRWYPTGSTSTGSPRWSSAPERWPYRPTGPVSCARRSPCGAGPCWPTWPRTGCGGGSGHAWKSSGSPLSRMPCRRTWLVVARPWPPRSSPTWSRRIRTGSGCSGCSCWRCTAWGARARPWPPTAMRELDALLARQAEMTTVVISTMAGVAGVGKTALALHWAARVRDRFADGQLYLNLRGFGVMAPVRPADALNQLLRGLGVPAERIPADQDEASAVYRTLLADRRVLVLLDNAHSVDQV